MSWAGSPAWAGRRPEPGRPSCWQRSGWQAAAAGRSRPTPAGCAGAWTWPPAWSRAERVFPGRADHRAGPGQPRPGHRIIRSLAASGATVLLTTQYLDEADQLASRIAVIDHGRSSPRGHPVSSRPAPAPGPCASGWPTRRNGRGRCSCWPGCSAPRPGRGRPGGAGPRASRPPAARPPQQAAAALASSPAPGIAVGEFASASPAWTRYSSPSPAATATEGAT